MQGKYIYDVFCDNCGTTLEIGADTMEEALEIAERVNCCKDYEEKLAEIVHDSGKE